jgi:hypothetical protein
MEISTSMIQSIFFLLDQKESKNQERSYRPIQVRALLRRLSFRPPLLVLVNSIEIKRYLKLQI